MHRFSHFISNEAWRPNCEGYSNGLVSSVAGFAADRPAVEETTSRRAAGCYTQNPGGQMRAFETLGMRRPVVVGHSWGALVALALALDHPEAVSGLILLSGYYHPTLRADVPFFSIPAIPVIGDLIRYTVGPFFGSALLPAGGKRHVGASSRAHTPKSLPSIAARRSGCTISTEAGSRHSLGLLAISAL
jgi:pimeloyl-ACP methyl ester carboxylesterase